MEIFTSWKSLEQACPALLRQLAEHFLAGLDHLALADLGWFLVEPAALDLRKDA